MPASFTVWEITEGGRKLRPLAEPIADRQEAEQLADDWTSYLQTKGRGTRATARPT